MLEFIVNFSKKILTPVEILEIENCNSIEANQFLIEEHLEPNDHEGESNNHDASVGKFQSKFVTLVLWGDYPIDESSWVGARYINRECKDES